MTFVEEFKVSHFIIAKLDFIRYAQIKKINRFTFKSFEAFLNLCEFYQVSILKNFNLL